MVAIGRAPILVAVDDALAVSETGAPGSLAAALLTCFAFTWLNPHVYLDTVVLLGSISTQFPGEEWSFAVGATTAVPAAAASDTDPGAGSPYDDMDINDLRIAILRILANPDSGKRVTKEANALLDDGTMEEMRTWLETGYRLAQFEDDQVAIFTIIGKPSSGRAVYAATGLL